MRPCRAAAMAGCLAWPEWPLRNGGGATPAPGRPRLQLMAVPNDACDCPAGHHAKDQGPAQRASGRHGTRPSGRLPARQRDAGEDPEEPGGLPGDQAHGLPAVRSRRGARDGERGGETGEVSGAVWNVGDGRTEGVWEPWRGQEREGGGRWAAAWSAADRTGGGSSGAEGRAGTGWEEGVWEGGLEGGATSRPEELGGP
eukprot:357281-Chlamydomonas_euryale.AAC.2